MAKVAFFIFLFIGVAILDAESVSAHTSKLVSLEEGCKIALEALTNHGGWEEIWGDFQFFSAVKSDYNKLRGATSKELGVVRRLIEQAALLYGDSFTHPAVTSIFIGPVDEIGPRFDERFGLGRIILPQWINDSNPRKRKAAAVILFHEMGHMLFFENLYRQERGPFIAAWQNAWVAQRNMLIGNYPTRNFSRTS